MLSYDSFMVCTSDVEIINKTSAEVCVLQTSKLSMLFPAPKERINLDNTNCLSSTSCNQRSLSYAPAGLDSHKSPKQDPSVSQTLQS